jgi:hypothetical protein
MILIWLVPFFKTWLNFKKFNSPKLLEIHYFEDGGEYVSNCQSALLESGWHSSQYPISSFVSDSYTSRDD